MREAGEKRKIAKWRLWKKKFHVRRKKTPRKEEGDQEKEEREEHS